MAAQDGEDDQAARKARAEAIRRARDARNARLRGEPTAPTDSDRAPSFVDLINQRMRRIDRDRPSDA